MAEELSAAAASAAQHGGTAKAVSVIKEVAMLQASLSQMQLQAETAKVSLECLHLCEQHAKRCVQLFVDALKAPSPTHELASDAAWALNKLTGRCAVTRQWMIDAEGIVAIRCAFVSFSSHNDTLVQCLLGIVHNLRGLEGLTSLIHFSASAAGAHLSDSVLAALVWSVSDVVKEGQGTVEGSVQAFQAILSVLLHRPQSSDVQDACCTALAALVHADARLGTLLVEAGRLPLILDTLRHAMTLGSGGDNIACSCANILVSVAQASSLQAAAIQEHGGAELLIQFGTRDAGRAHEEAAIWAIGHIAGIGAVVNVMSAASTLPAVIRGGLDAITELACSLNSLDDIGRLPDILRRLRSLLAQILTPDSPIKCRKKCFAAICSTMMGLAPHVEPGQIDEFDRTVVDMLELQKTDLRIEADVEIAENIVETLGRIALVKPSWHGLLQGLNAEQVFVQRIQTGRGHSRLLKYSFWAAAALSGLPFVCNQLQQNLRCADTIDAAFCTIIDILDDDLEGDWVLRDAKHCSRDAIPGILKLISEAMRGYVLNTRLTSRGCHCIGLLVALIPKAAVPAECIQAVFNALRRHRRSVEVVRDAMYAFHILLEPGNARSGNTTSGGSLDTDKAVVETLREGGIEAIAWQALSDHAEDGNAELLEETVIVLCETSSVGTTLAGLVEAGPGPALTAGIKAIFEFGRQRPTVLHDSARMIKLKVMEIAASSVADETLQQNSALLVGFCDHLSGCV
eukprot:TRINITY_DN44596_c0_g1_i1.p1 TRINITY_DN44596_c0_g1~~TRINITY_DN44596_c0_g1_i1.p1  ORF type:complete len:741 (+),score=132.56 TRINITY_DN44596_c0_g1_i1:52-2274(+)